MRAIDFSPLYRSAIGFDRMASMLDSAARSEQNGFPPYNIETQGEGRYRITMAVAGYAESELSIETENNTLTVSGKKEQKEEPEYLYKGIAFRNFERKFQLADHVKVINAGLENGLLHVNLEREIPEAMKPRKIEISRKNAAIEGEKSVN